jgi:hypothetical protein
MNDTPRTSHAPRTDGEPFGEIRIEGHVRIDIDSEKGRFEIGVGEHVAFLEAIVEGPVLSIVHTDVPAQLRGDGLGEVLARAALDFARSRGMMVKPHCQFVAGYMARTPEYQDLLLPGGSGADPGD